jgi:hypothetical protein
LILDPPQWKKGGKERRLALSTGQGRDTKEPAQSQKPSNSGRDRQAQEHRTHREMNVIRTGGERERGCAIPVLPSTQPETGARAHPRSTSSPFLIIPSPLLLLQCAFWCLSPLSPQESSRTSQSIQINQQLCALAECARCFFATPFPSSRSSWIGSMDAKRGTGPRKLPVPNIAISCFSSSLASFVCASSQLYVRPGQHSRCNTVPVLRIGPLSALI